jgi:hypothetical protein
MEKIIGEYTYWLADDPKVVGDWVVSKNQINEQIGTTNTYMNSYDQPSEIFIGQCKIDDTFNTNLLVADNIAMCGPALQERTYKIVKTNNPNIKFNNQ